MSEATIATALLDRLDTLIAARHLLKHPFYLAWTAGELSPDALRDYAGQYYQHVKAFPTYLSALHAHTDNLDVRRQLVANLNDEEGFHPTHPELWLQFANSLGLSDNDTDCAMPNDRTLNTIATFRDICADRSVAEGLAALYAYECQIPAVSQSKIAGLRNFYGFTNEQTWAYFTEHIVADVEHSAAERAMLEDVTTDANGEEKERILAAAAAALDAINGLLSGVAETHGIEC